MQSSIKFLFLSACVALTSVSCTKNRSPSYSAVISVNGHVLNSREFSSLLAYKLRHLDALTVKDPLALRRIKEDLLRDFIISKLTEDWAKANGVFVRQEDLETEISKVRKAYPDDLTFEKSLREEGLSFKDWKSFMTNSALQKLVAKKLAEKIEAPNETEMKSYYTNNKELFARPAQVRLRQVVTANEADARVIEENLKKGKSLKEMATKFSISSEGKKAEGDIGWIEKGVLEGFDKAFSMRPGQRSNIFKSPYGYHIFEVIATRSAINIPFSEAMAQIQRQIMANREQALYTSWLEAEIKKAHVLKDDDLIGLIKVETKD